MKKLTGMKDFTEETSIKYNLILNTASKIAENYTFKFIKTPLLEETSLFKRTAGEETDVVSKEMYSFTDRAGSDISLRPEGTASIMRYFLENGMDKLKTKKRLFYYGSMFRYERPQKGRFREFNQFGFESLGENSIYEDINMILMASSIFNALDIEFTLNINSLGCKECREKYILKLKEYINLKDDICDDCKTRKDNNPLRVLDCKKDNYYDAPKINECLCESCNNSFEIVKKELNMNKIKFNIDSSLVRGLDYYNNLVYEFTSSKLGAQDAICGGGRYDNLSEQLGGKHVPAVGFAFGIERVMDLITLKEEKEDSYYICAFNEKTLSFAIQIGNKFRNNNKVNIDYTFKSVPKQIKKAEKLGANKFIIIGENEVNDNFIKIKDLETGKEETIIP